MGQIARRKYTPPEIAKMFGVEPGKVIAWIRNGELRAIDGATRRGRRPRFLIDVVDLEAFERSRAVVPQPPPVPRRRRTISGVTEFF